MARSVEAIAAAMRSAFMADPTLQQVYGFAPGTPFERQFSPTSAEAIDIQVVAQALADAEHIQEQDVENIRLLLANNEVGTRSWYAQVVRLFQYSDSVHYYLIGTQNGVPVYNIVNPDDRMITQSAVSETNDGIVSGTSAPELPVVKIKIATGKPGNLKPITSMQLIALENFMRAMKMAGVRVQIVNLPADLLKVEASVYYSPEVNVTLLKSMIVDALNKYSVSVDFNGVIFRRAVEDAIQAVAGVVDVDLTTLTAVRGEIQEPIGQRYMTYAGYFNLYKDSDYPRINLTPLNA